MFKYVDYLELIFMIFKFKLFVKILEIFRDQ